MQTHHYINFVDLMKFFDTVNRDGLSKSKQKFRCPERFTHMVRQLHDAMMARVTDSRTVSDESAVTNELKHGCVLVPNFLSLIFSAMLRETYRDERPGIRIAYRTDGHLLIRQRMQTPTRLPTTTVHEMYFADTLREADMQRSMDLLASASHTG
ncbi:hypothetical protein SprV_0401662800 [Sparganum proliferum]